MWLLGAVSAAVSLGADRAVDTARLVCIETRWAWKLHSSVTCIATLTELAPADIATVDKVLARRTATQEQLEVRCGEVIRS